MKDESFTIVIAETVRLQITRYYVNGDLTYRISSGDKILGSIVPDIDDNLGLIWRTSDNIHPWLLYKIGRQIDSYEA